MGLSNFGHGHPDTVLAKVFPKSLRAPARKRPDLRPITTGKETGRADHFSLPHARRSPDTNATAPAAKIERRQNPERLRREPVCREAELHRFPHGSPEAHPIRPMMIRHLLLAAAALAPLITTARAEPPDTGEIKPVADKTAWFRDAKFGMFIHWGLYSIPAGEYTDPKTGKISTDHAEWYLESTKMPVTEYEKFLPRFNPVKFDADAWAQAAAEAGARYVCITGKHHDGFAMFPSKVTGDWNFGLTPMGKTGRDPLMELKLACEKRGVAFCLYHTIMDWRSTDYAERRAHNDRPGAKQPADMDRFQDFLEASVAEAIGRYHPRMMWFDGSWEGCWTPARGHRLQAKVRALAPEMIVNDRIGPGAAGTGGLGKSERFGDYTTPEQFIPEKPLPEGRAWETCMTMNDHWGFNKADHKWKSSETLIRNLVDIASKGGNLLLNVGPDASGEIPAASLQRLADIGRWMKANGDSIHGTTASPFAEKFDWGRVTAKGDTLYLHVFRRPEDGVIRLPLKNIARDARLLDSGERLVTGQAVGDGPKGSAHRVNITLPATLPDPIDTVITVKLSGTPKLSPH